MRLLLFIMNVKTEADCLLPNTHFNYFILSKFYVLKGNKLQLSREIMNQLALSIEIYSKILRSISRFGVQRF